MTLLATEGAGLKFQNPLLLAAGTAAYGRELLGVMPIDDMGGIVTKAVSVEQRNGAPAPRVAEFEGGMINAVGLANPGLEEVRTKDLPWLKSNLKNARIIVNVVGNSVEDFATVISGLEDSESSSAPDAYELNVSCPNVKSGGMEFGADKEALSQLILSARAATKRPVFVKLSPTLPNIADTAKVAVDAGANGITVINTIPGMIIDVESRKPRLGFGSGGVSGQGLLPVGVLATWKVSRAVNVPIIGVGGVSKGTDVVQYLLAGASLVAVGTAAMQDPRAPKRIIKELSRWCEDHKVSQVADLVGKLEWFK